MPLYEYACQDCGHEFEVIQKFSDRPLRRCPSCDGKLRKKISRTSFQLKGGGWFDQGYGGGGGSDKPADKPSDKPADKPAGKKQKKESKGAGSAGG